MKHSTSGLLAAYWYNKDDNDSSGFILFYNHTVEHENLAALKLIKLKMLIFDAMGLLERYF